MLQILSKKLKTFLFKKKVKSFKNNSGATVVPAFIYDGVQYYEVPGFFNMPYKRAMAARDVLMEVDARVTKEYLQLHIKKVKEILSNPATISILDLSTLYNELDNRVKWIASPEAIYKLAAVYYFDENESVEDINWDYCQKKIVKWKEGEVGSFFLQDPIKKYIPHSELLEKGIWKSDEDLVNYIREAIEMELLMKSNLS